MYYRPVFLIALRYIYSKTVDRFYQCIYWFSSIFLMLSISMIIIILSVMNGFEYELKENLLYLTPHITITAAKGYTNIHDFPNFLSKNNILSIIKHIKPLVISDVMLQSFNSISIGTMLGICPNHFEPLFKYLVKNNIGQLTSGKYYVIISAALAKKLSVNISDQIRLIVPTVHYHTPFGCFPVQRLFTVLDIYTITYDDFDSYQVFIHKDDAANLMHYPSSQYITGWRIWVYDPFKLNNFDYLDIPQDWYWTDWRKSKGSVFQAIKLEKNIMFFLFILIIIISGFNIIAFLLLLITEKKRDIAILKTYGFNQIQVMLLFIIQGMSSSIFGILWGIILGIFFSKNLNEIIFFLGLFSENLCFFIDIQYFQIFNIIIWVLVWIFLIILYPAWYISSICPAKVLRNG